MDKNNQIDSENTTEFTEADNDTQLEPMTQDFGEVFAAWQFPEHIKHVRSKKWYILFSSIYIIIILIAIFGLYIPFTTDKATIHFGLSFDRSPLLAIIMVMLAIIYIYLDKKDVENHAIAITEDGILLNNKLIEYNDLHDFYIIYYPPNIKNLYLRSKSLFNTLSSLGRSIVVPLEDENPVAIRQALLKYLPEDLSKEHMPTTEAISRLIKF